jgi:uncharacterized damage-inducible protein DinB
MTRRSCLLALPISLRAQVRYPGLGRGWDGEFELASRQLLALAEATPAAQFSFRPATGVRSTSELYMHVAMGNYGLLAAAGAKTGGAHWPKEIRPDHERTVKDKQDVVGWLGDSFLAVKAARGTFDESRMVEFIGGKVPASQVMLRLLLHNHEHMGQAIAYARMCGVRPPWSA